MRYGDVRRAKELFLLLHIVEDHFQSNAALLDFVNGDAEKKNAFCVLFPKFPTFQSRIPRPLCTDDLE